MVRTHGDDADEQQVIDDIRTYGCHIIGIEDDPEGPGFAYSVGLFHTYQHPEIILAGLNSAQVMMQIVNSIGELVRAGHQFADWHESDQVFEGVNCIFRTLPVEFYPDYLGYALWYYRSPDFSVLQCIWPDRSGRYPWHPDCAPSCRQRQALFTHASSWPFREPKNRAAFTTKYVLDGSRPIVLVSHDAEGDWQFLCGTTNHSPDARLVSLESIVELHPAIAQFADLPSGWQAFLDPQTGTWQRQKRPAE